MMPRAPSRRSRIVSVLLASTIAVAGVGFLTATRSPPERRGYRPASSARTSSGSSGGATTPAPRQAEMSRARRATRTEELRAAFAILADVPRNPDGTMILDAEETARLAARGEGLRAYPGAPPRVPHAVDERGMPACLTCHEHGLRIGDRVAPQVRHEERASCLQCHAPPSGLRRPMRGEGP